jgi:hypothetical protein
MADGFGHRDITWDHGFKNNVAEEFTDVFVDFMGEL